MGVLNTPNPSYLGLRCLNRSEDYHPTHVILYYGRIGFFSRLVVETRDYRSPPPPYQTVCSSRQSGAGADANRIPYFVFTKFSLVPFRVSSSCERLKKRIELKRQNDSMFRYHTVHALPVMTTDINYVFTRYD